MAKNSRENNSGNEEKKNIIDTIKEDRYVLIMALAVVIFIASSSLAIITAPNQAIAPVPSVIPAVDGSTVTLTWGASPTASVTGYDVYRSSEQGALGVKLTSAPQKTLSYSEKLAPGTYYYVVRAVAGNADDANTKQVKVVLASIVPAGLTVTINNGSNFTSSPNVVLHLTAANAKECRFKNDEDPQWGPWEQYAQEKSWTLSSGGDGDRIVAYQCMNTAESNIGLATVVLDTHAPSAVYSLTSASNELQMGIVAGDQLSTLLSCTITVDGNAERKSVALSPSDVGTFQYRGTYSYRKTVSPGEHTIGLSCSDEAGNVYNAPTSTLST